MYNPFPSHFRYETIDELTGKTLTSHEDLEEAQNALLTDYDVVNTTIHDTTTKEVWWFDDVRWRTDT